MNDQPETKPSNWERSNIVRTCRWLCSKRGMRRVFIVLAWIVTIIGLWYGEENWRGRRAWNQYRKATEARGESLDYAAYIPKPVPDDQNFAATPFLKSFFLQPDTSILTNDLYIRASGHITKTKIVKDNGRRLFTDLVAWQLASITLQNGKLNRDETFETDETDLASRAAAAPAVLEGMKPDQAAFAELRAASAREFSRYRVKYDFENPWNTLLPHLSKIKQGCLCLELESCAELAAGQTGQALADVKLMLSLADSVKSEPFLISYLVRVACFQIAIQPVWEGLAEHRWTDAQLQELQARFLSCDFLADAEWYLTAERARHVVTVNIVKRNGMGRITDFMNLMFGEAAQSPLNKVVFNLIGPIVPSGWYYQEELNYCVLFDAQMKGVVDRAAKTVSPSEAESNASGLTGQIYGDPRTSALKAFLRHRLIVWLMLPTFNNFFAKIAIAQTTANQAALACALERYRLANGQFPESLEALSPHFMSRLPNDVITGRPYKYRRADDGQFILYSVGWNEKDDGGAPGKVLFDRTQGDWVWQYPE